MPKRKRDFSDSGIPDHLPLTEANLNCHDRLEAVMGGSRRSSPARADNNLDRRNKLEAYRIYVDTTQLMPAKLAAHIETIVRRPRDATTAVSPNSKNAVKRRRHAASQNERTGVKQLAPHLLFVGEAEMDDRVDAVPHVAVKDEINLNRFFLPPSPSADITKTWGLLSQPRPDMCIGYVTQSDASKAEPRVGAPFTTDEESILNNYCLSQYLFFPFLTAQWKVPNSTENLHAAQNQAARDGAVIVNYLYNFYTVAYGCTPSTEQVCHFSWVCDLEYGQLWVHWREGDKHYMQFVDDCSLRKEDAVRNARSLLRNIMSYSLSERLQSIKNALPLFAQNGKASHPYPPMLATESTASPSEPSVSIPPISFHPTPSSSVSSEPTKTSSVSFGPSKKRSRLNSDGGFDE